MLAKQVYFIAHFLLVGLALIVVSAVSYHSDTSTKQAKRDNNLLIALIVLGLINLATSGTIWYRGDRVKGFTHFSLIAFITSAICFIFFLIRAAESSMHRFRDSENQAMWNIGYLAAGLVSVVATIILHEYGSYA